MNEVLKIEHLTKSYGKHRGVVDLSLEVNQGEIYGFLGPNGAGKSTTIRSILGLNHFTDGRIHVFGKDVRGNQTEVLKQIGYMPSEAMFYNNMRVEEVLKFAADSRKADCKEEAEKLCDCLQVDLKKKISELSLGNRKKVSIICAMQHKPDLYIFDEPTSGLDPLMQKEFFTLIEERRAKGATFFLSSHVLSEVRQYCDRVAIIKEGRFICVDTVENLAKTNAKRVIIKGIETLPELPEIVNVKKKNWGNYEFVYKGNIVNFLKAIDLSKIKDLVIEEPSLEEIFMHFYENKEVR